MDKPYKEIFVFGASITYGAWDRNMGGWVNRLRHYVDNRYDNIEVHNLGFSGETSAHVLRRCEFEIQGRIADNKEDCDTIAIVAIGTNDSSLHLESGEPFVSEADFRTNLESIADKLQAQGVTVYFMGLGLIQEDLVNPCPWYPAIAYTDLNIRTYDNVIRNVSKIKAIQYIDIYREVFQASSALLLKDGIHPNSEGHEKIYEEVLRVLKLFPE